MKFLDTLASYIPSIIVDELQSQVESGGHKTAPYRIEFDTAHNDASFSLSLSLSKFDKPPFLTYAYFLLLIAVTVAQLFAIQQGVMLKI